MQLRTELQRRFPHVLVEGANHPPSAAGKMASAMVSTAQMVLILAATVGEGLASALGVPPPAVLEGLKQNRMAVCAGAWFVGSAFSQSMLKTGAFEVSLDGELVWSGMQTGRPPNGPGEVLKALYAHGLR